MQNVDKIGEYNIRRENDEEKKLEFIVLCLLFFNLKLFFHRLTSTKKSFVRYINKCVNSTFILRVLYREGGAAWLGLTVRTAQIPDQKDFLLVTQMNVIFFSWGSKGGAALRHWRSLLYRTKGIIDLKNEKRGGIFFKPRGVKSILSISRYL